VKAIKTFGTAIRAGKGERGMSAGTDLSEGELLVLKEAPGVKLHVSVDAMGSAGHASIRLERAAVRALIKELTEALG
jgi:hypothetical protein